MEGFFRAIEAYQRLRANFNGIRTKAATEKKERLITQEAESADVLTELYLQDGLMQRQIGIELMKKHAIITQGESKISEWLVQKEPETDGDEEGKKGKENNKEEN
jgi:hypothetical protein